MIETSGPRGKRARSGYTPANGHEAGSRSRRGRRAASRDALALCQSLALSTREIPFGTSIANIYTRHPFDYAQTAAVIHELSGGRFRFGIGVSHGATHERLGLQAGRPLDDIRKFVGEVAELAPQ